MDGNHDKLACITRCFVRDGEQPDAILPAFLQRVAKDDQGALLDGPFA